jgi:hypothetical protein
MYLHSRMNFWRTYKTIQTNLGLWNATLGTASTSNIEILESFAFTLECVASCWIRLSEGIYKHQQVKNTV